jgi:hypothetical protein
VSLWQGHFWTGMRLKSIKRGVLRLSHRRSRLGQSFFACFPLGRMVVIIDNALIKAPPLWQERCLQSSGMQGTTPYDDPV